MLSSQVMSPGPLSQVMKEAPDLDRSASSGQYRGGYAEKADYESRTGGNPGANGWFLESTSLQMPP
jgi:hypothetical protein